MKLFQSIKFGPECKAMHTRSSPATRVEKFDLEVIGVMPNFLGPQQSIILVQLKGTRVERTGVVVRNERQPGLS